MAIDPEVQHFSQSPTGCVATWLFRLVIALVLLVVAGLGGLTVWLITK
jgi:hypothetical protein